MVRHAARKARGHADAGIACSMPPAVSPSARIKTSGTITGSSLTLTPGVIDSVIDDVDADGNPIEIPVEISTVTASTNPATTSFVSQTTKAGFAVGAGAEIRLAGNWTGRVEYLYLDFGRVATVATNSANSTPLAINFDSRVTNQIARVGLNYKFDPTGAVYAAPTNAKSPMLFKAPLLAAWNWAGPYVGATIGYGAGKSKTDIAFSDAVSGAELFATSASHKLDGAIGGAQVGYNWLAGIWLAGIEGELNYSGQRAKLNAVCPGEILQSRPHRRRRRSVGDRQLRGQPEARVVRDIARTPRHDRHTRCHRLCHRRPRGRRGDDRRNRLRLRRQRQSRQHDRGEPQHQSGLCGRRRPRRSAGRQLDGQDRVPLPRSRNGHARADAGTEFDGGGRVQFPHHRQHPAPRRELQVRSRHDLALRLIRSKERDMAKKPLNQGKPWTSRDESEFDALAKQNTPTRLIASKMGRTLEAIYSESEAKRHFAEIDRSIALWKQEVERSKE